MFRSRCTASLNCRRSSEPEETGQTFQDNARLKASYYAQHLSTTAPPWAASALIVAEDSGLVIDALDGEPGVRSARYLREERHTRSASPTSIAVSPCVQMPRGTARFLCALTTMRGDRVVFETIGTVEGEIASAPAGSGGFGYDPIFLFPAYGKTLAEVSDDEKLRVAHRGHAFRALAVWLQTEKT